VRPWDVLVSTVRPNRKNVALVPDIEGKLPLVASTGFSVLRFASKEEAVFYHAWLRSDAATQQLMQWNAGGSYPAIDDEVPIRTLVPPFAPETVTAHGKRWLLKFTGEGLAHRLTTAAKLLVEWLIDGKLTEANLQLAHTDHDADWAVLRRLTAKGLDVADESVLFPDLTQLEQALADAGGPAT
jgi:type I restriction enzyme S subunit